MKKEVTCSQGHRNSNTDIKKEEALYIYIYIYVCVCVCV